VTQAASRQETPSQAGSKQVSKRSRERARKRARRLGSSQGCARAPKTLHMRCRFVCRAAVSRGARCLQGRVSGKGCKPASWHVAASYEAWKLAGQQVSKPNEPVGGEADEHVGRLASMSASQAASKQASKQGGHLGGRHVSEQVSTQASEQQCERACNFLSVGLRRQGAWRSEAAFLRWVVGQPGGKATTRQGWQANKVAGQQVKGRCSAQTVSKRTGWGMAGWGGVGPGRTAADTTGRSGAEQGRMGQNLCWPGGGLLRSLVCVFRCLVFCALLLSVSVLFDLGCFVCFRFLVVFVSVVVVRGARGCVGVCSYAAQLYESPRRKPG